MIIEHIEYRAGDHDAFVAAFVATRAVRLAARGCRRVEVSRGGEGGRDYRVRIEWRSRAEQETFASSAAAHEIAKSMAAFEERARHVDERLPIVSLARDHPSAPALSHRPIVPAGAPRGQAG